MSIKRRDFIKRSAASGLALSTGSFFAMGSAASVVEPRRIGPNDKLNVLSVGVRGTVGGSNTKEVASHPRVRIAGLCDLDTMAMDRAAQDYPDAFQVADYREAFDRYGDRFDAVICSTPDHTHCAIETLALTRGKHVYGEKPLVQQLEELALLGSAVRANPGLSTQMGNQRMERAGRRAAVHILKAGTLGKVEAIFRHDQFGACRRREILQQPRRQPD